MPWNSIVVIIGSAFPCGDHHMIEPQSSFSTTCDSLGSVPMRYCLLLPCGIQFYPIEGALQVYFGHPYKSKTILVHILYGMVKGSFPNQPRSSILCLRDRKFPFNHLCKVFAVFVMYSFKPLKEVQFKIFSILVVVQTMKTIVPFFCEVSKLRSTFSVLL